MLTKLVQFHLPGQRASGSQARIGECYGIPKNKEVTGHQKLKGLKAISLRDNSKLLNPIFWQSQAPSRRTRAGPQPKPLPLVGPEPRL